MMAVITIKLHTKKSVLSLQVDKIPDEEYVRYGDRVFKAAERGSPADKVTIWEEFEGKLPADAAVYTWSEPNPEEKQVKERRELEQRTTTSEVANKPGGPQGVEPSSERAETKGGKRAKSK